MWMGIYIGFAPIFTFRMKCCSIELVDLALNKVIEVLYNKIMCESVWQLF